MSSIDKPETLVGILTNVATLLAFVFFVVPGFVSLRTYEALRGGEGQKINDAIIEVVIFSFATDVVAVPLLLLTAQIPNVALRYLSLAAVGLTLLVGLPIFLGRQGYLLQRRLSEGGVISHPTLKPWDEIFTRIAREKREMGVILTLHDGRKFGGKYVEPGFADSRRNIQRMSSSYSAKAGRLTKTPGVLLSGPPGATDCSSTRKTC